MLNPDGRYVCMYDILLSHFFFWKQGFSLAGRLSAERGGGGIGVPTKKVTQGVACIIKYLLHDHSLLHSFDYDNVFFFSSLIYRGTSDLTFICNLEHSNCQ